MSHRIKRICVVFGILAVCFLILARLAQWYKQVDIAPDGSPKRKIVLHGGLRVRNVEHFPGEGITCILETSSTMPKHSLPRAGEVDILKCADGEVAIEDDGDWFRVIWDRKGSPVKPGEGISLFRYPDRTQPLPNRPFNGRFTFYYSTPGGELPRWYQVVHGKIFFFTY